MRAVPVAIAAATSTFIAGLTSSLAIAHVTIEPKNVSRGPIKFVLRVPHGCAGSSTTSLQIAIPEGLIGVKPMPKPGWAVEVTKGAYARSYDYFHGTKMSEGTKTVTWSGGRLEDGHFDEFALIGYVSDAFNAGDWVYIPATQHCEEGSMSWNQIPAPGIAASSLKTPAPRLTIIAPTGNDPHHR